MKVLGGVLAGLAVPLLCTGFGTTTVFRSPEYGFSVSAPVTLATDGPQQRTTNYGQSFTQITYLGSVTNGDTYFASVATYPFSVANDDLQRALDGFSKAINGTPSEVQTTSISGQPALRATVTLPDTLRFQYVATYKNNRLFQFSVGTDSSAPFDSPEIKTFSESAMISDIDTPQ